MSAGIGDNMIALACVVALKKKYPNDHIVFATNRKDWMELFTGYDELVHPPLRNIGEIITYNPYGSYKLELLEKGKRTRAEYYADLVDHVTPCLPGVKPLPDSPYPGCICLVPFTAWDSRTYQLAHWLTIEKMLIQEGYKVVILDDNKNRTSSFVSEKVLGQPPQTVASIMKGARLVVGGDSGMQHVAGALQVPTLVVCAAAKGKMVFGTWPSVEVLQATKWCNGCYWSGDGFSDACNNSCAALQEITPEEVFSRAVNRLK